jgi:hypothetical protein
MTTRRPSVRWTRLPLVNPAGRVRRLHDGVIGGECGECGNVTAPLTFRQGRWCCTYCLTTDLMVADLGKPTGPEWMDPLFATVALALWITLILSHLP